MNAYKLTVRTENKNTKTGATTLSDEAEHYFGEYAAADKFVAEKFEKMVTFGSVEETGEVRVGKFAADAYAGIFETSELVSRTVINITRVKIN